MPANVVAAVIVLQALHGLSDADAVDELTFDLRWKAACGLPVATGGVGGVEGTMAKPVNAGRAVLHSPVADGVRR